MKKPLFWNKGTNPLRNQNGSILIQVMILGLVLAASGFGMMNMLNAQNKQIDYLQMTQDMTAFRRTIENNLQTTHTCTEALRGSKVTSSSLNVNSLISFVLYQYDPTLDAVASRAYTTDSALPGAKSDLVLSSMKLKNITKIADGNDTDQLNQYTAILQINVKRKNNLPAPVRPLEIKLAFLTTPATPASIFIERCLTTVAIESSTVLSQTETAKYAKASCPDSSFSLTYANGWCSCGSAPGSLQFPGTVKIGQLDATVRCDGNDFICGPGQTLKPYIQVGCRLNVGGR